MTAPHRPDTGRTPLWRESRNEGLDAAVAAVRRLTGSLLAAGDHGGDALDTVAARLHALADGLDARAPRLPDRLREMWSGEGTGSHDPAAGPHNPLAPPMRLSGRPDGAVEAELTLGLAYQGPPGCAHGGVSALLLDHALGVANHWGDGPTGMTAELTLRYLRPVPLFRPVTVTARQVTSEGRKIRATGSIHADGELCVRADGFFIAVDHFRPGGLADRVVSG